MENKTILHVDLNNFYASVECHYHVELRGKPVAVGGDAEKRHGIILAKNYLAKDYGVRTGDALWQAKQKCPDLVIVPPHYDLYLKYSRLAREIYQEYTSQVESFGLDECWLDVTGSTHLYGDGKQIADTIRARIKYELGVTASVGVSFNKVFAKLGSDMKKPDATTVISPENFRSIVWPLPVEELLYVGRATKRKLWRYGISTIGELAATEESILHAHLGKIGVMLWNFANGRDFSHVEETGWQPIIKSIGNSTTAPRDLVTEDDVKITLYVLCESVAERLREHKFRCGTVQISLRDNQLFWYERQGKLRYPTHASTALFDKAFALYKTNHLSGKPLRSIGVKACQLSADNGTQLSFLPELAALHKREEEERVIDDIRRRFGHFSIQRGMMLEDQTLSGLDPKGEHVIYPVSFLR